MQINLMESLWDNLEKFLKTIDSTYKPKKDSLSLAVDLGLPADSENVKENALRRDLSRMLTDYYFYLKRHISVKPRVVRVSEHLRCPEELNTYYEEFRRKVEVGENINPYLSKRTLRLSNDDKLLSHWGIYHFHLGEIWDRNDFSERSGPVLFVYFCDNTAFFIDIREHGSWSDYSLIETVCKEFPEGMKSRKIEWIRIVEPVIKESNQIAAMRKVNLNMIVVVDGICYGNIGVMGDGTDGESLMRSYRILMLIKNIEETIKEQENKLLEHFKTDELKVTCDLYNDSRILKIIIKVNNKELFEVEL